MQSGSYHRIGKFDVWYGYQSRDLNTLRFEWFGDGQRFIEIRLDSKSIKVEKLEDVTRIAATSNKGLVEINCYSSRKTKVKVGRGLMPIFSASGIESGYKVFNLVDRICHANEI